MRSFLKHRKTQPNKQKMRASCAFSTKLETAAVCVRRTLEPNGGSAEFSCSLREQLGNYTLVPGASGLRGIWSLPTSQSPKALATPSASSEVFSRNYSKAVSRTLNCPFPPIAIVDCLRGAGNQLAIRELREPRVVQDMRPLH